MLINTLNLSIMLINTGRTTLEVLKQSLVSSEAMAKAEGDTKDGSINDQNSLKSTL